MLNSIRRQAGSWIVKALLLLLVVSFAVWGIGDVFYGGRQNPAIAEVGGTEILASDVTNEFNRRVNELQRQLGTGIDRERAVQLGLMHQALQDLIARRLVDLRAREMGLALPDDALRQMIVEHPAFQTGGRFDRSRFQQLVRASGMSEDGYLAALRQDVVRTMLTESLTAPVEVPATLVESLYKHRNEQRRGRMLVVQAAAITDLPAPAEGQLAQYHAEHEDQFRAPEYRTVTLIGLDTEDLIDEVEVSEEEIEATYQDRIRFYGTPERRTVDQLLASEPEAIEQAAARIAEGVDLEQVAGELADQGVTLSELGAVTPGQLPPAMNDAIFALEEGAVSAPVESPFGWHLFHVSAIEPEQVTPLEEVRDDISRELALEQAQRRLPRLANALDDELAAGATLEEAAQTLGLEVRTVEAVDAQGLTPAGEQEADVPAGETFLEIAFDTPAGETSLLEDSADGGYFVLRVDQVQPARVRTVEEVGNQLLEAWQAEQRRQQARERAEALLAQMNEGIALDKVAADAGFQLRDVGPVKRNERRPDPGVVRALFSTEPGSFAGQVMELPEGFALVATDEVIGANPADDPQALERLRAELREEMRADILAQFGAALREAYSVQVHEAELQRLMGADGLMPTGAAGTVF